MAVSSSTGGAEAGPPVSYLRQSTFAIPFNATADTVEVQLYVSIDRGSSWHLYAQQRPDAKRFRFRASQDGEYWFASRTIDRTGAGRPASIQRPERRVIVDSRQPRLTVQATSGSNGEVQASWDAEDEHLAPTTFKLGYRTDRDPNWKLAPAPAATEARPFQGRTAFQAPAGARVVQLHAEIADAAGNWAVVERQLTLAAVSPGPANPAPPGVAGATSGAAVGATVAAPGAAPGATGATIPAVPPTGSAESSDPPRSASPLTTDTPGYSDSSVGSSGSSGSSSGSASIPPRDPPSTIDPEIPAPGELPGGERPRMSASRKFSLEYDIESAGPGGVSEVELWMTRDRGATWSRHAVDSDKTSPIEVEVDADGVYGVRVVVVSASGLASTAPRAGDPADLWVGVDTTKPVVQFSSVSYGEGANAGQLDIRWTADDQRFGPRPIQLAYAETTAGPWTPVASGLPNTGRYLWSVDAYVPKKIVLRIEARDEAGNSGVHELTDPISLQGLTPSARVKGVQPR